MLIGEDFVRAEDKYRRERLRDQNKKMGTLGKLATLIVVASLVLAACGVEDNTERGRPNVPESALIQDLAPIGHPDLTVVFPYRLPEMWPVAPRRVTGVYQLPEMWPVAPEWESPQSGPR